MRLSGDALRVERLTARSGRGTLALDGSIGLLAPGLPVDLRLVARDASPIQLDLLDAEGDADLRLDGRATENLSATGSVRLSRISSAGSAPAAAARVRRSRDRRPRHP